MTTVLSNSVGWHRTSQHVTGAPMTATCARQMPNTGSCSTGITYRRDLALDAAQTETARHENGVDTFQRLVP